jgi:hypothetical protein
MSAAIRRRLNDILAARARQTRRKGGNSYMEDVREWLQSVDGHPVLGSIPGEGLHDEMVRRLQVADGWNLAALPGETTKQRWTNADLIAQGTLTVSDEARHAARHWIGMWEGI